jgi:hypothetical protein
MIYKLFSMLFSLISLISTSGISLPFLYKGRRKFIHPYLIIFTVLIITMFIGYIIISAEDIGKISSFSQNWIKFRSNNELVPDIYHELTFLPKNNKDEM